MMRLSPSHAQFLPTWRKGKPHMNLAEQLLERIAHTSDLNERARLRSRLAKELESSGDYESACEVMGELWQGVGERPHLEGLDEATHAEVLMRVGALTGCVGSAKQIG